MDNMSYKDSAQDILEAIGGAGNVAETNHCATRLRFRVNDPKKINDDKVKKFRELLVLLLQVIIIRLLSVQMWPMSIMNL